MTALPARRFPLARGAFMLLQVAWLAACRQTPAPKPPSSPPPPTPVTAGQIAPAIPAPPPTSSSPARPSAPTPAAVATAPKPRPPTTAKPPPGGAAAAVVKPSPAAKTPPALDLAALEQRLKDTKAIGVFTKLSLKNQVDDLLDEARSYHRNPSPSLQTALRQQFEELMLKVLSSLQSGDPQLAASVAASRDALWTILMDPEKLSKI